MRRIQLVLGATLGTFACAPTEHPRVDRVPPVQVRNAIAEGALATLELTAQAVARLGIATESVVAKTIARTRLLGGNAIVPPGRSVIVRAPLAGTLLGAPPPAGTMLRTGAIVFELAPRLTPEVRATLTAAAAAAEGTADAAAARLDAAEQALARAERIQREGAGSIRAVEEARAEHTTATAAHKAARAQREVLANVGGDTDRLRIDAPFDGVLAQILAAPGMTVAADAPLFAVEDHSMLWIEVPVYVGELDAFDATLPVQIGPLGGPSATLTRTATPVQAPPAATPAAASASLFYVVDNKDGALRPGQRCGVRVPRRGDRDLASTAPASAIVYDAHGGTWVYEKTAATTFVRRRVEVHAVEDGTAIFARGPSPGAELVTIGAAELFGTEFFQGK